MLAIRLTNVSKSYGKKVLFKDFSLEVEKGEFVAITGASGIGKTTLLNMIGLIEDTSTGDIEICGIKNPKFYAKEGIQILREKISYLFQNYGLIEDKDVAYNLHIATKFLRLSRKKEKELFDSALSEVGLSGVEHRKIYELSGGEQQRVALAKALLKPSEIILADEPTGSLDRDNRNIVMSILQKMHKSGKTIIVVTHDSEVAECCERNIVL